MSTEIINKEQGVLRVKINLTPDEYIPAVNTELKKIRMNANIPGFRQGHVPMGYLKKVYGKSILADTLPQILTQEITNLTNNENVKTIGQPVSSENEYKPQNYVWDFKETFVFHYEIPTYNDFVIPDYNTIECEKQVADINDENIDHEIEELRNIYGEYVEIKEVEKDSYLSLSITVKSRKENQAEPFSFSTQISIDKFHNKKLAKEISVLKKSDDKITLLLKEYFENDKDLESFLNANQEDAKFFEDEFEIMLKNIRRKEVAEINEEFFKKIYPQQEENIGLEKFRELIKESLIIRTSNFAQTNLNTKIQENLMESIAIDLPEEFFKRELKKNEKVPEEKFDEQFERFIQGLKWSLIIKKIFDSEGLNISEKELSDLAKYRVYSYYAQQTPNFPMDEKMLEKVATNILKDEKQKSDLEDELTNRKVLDVLLKKIVIKEKTTSYNEIVKM